MERKDEKKGIIRLSDIDRKVLLSYSKNTPEALLKPTMNNTAHSEPIVKIQ
ncbi:MAG: hypothetical protein N3I35_10630 [Clostridia bacterium]|nr:hypothetical protein [Clostridia bacterium]